MGIPARPVTNFESAHDADANRAIDYYYDLEDEIVEEKSGDSVWCVCLCVCARNCLAGLSHSHDTTPTTPHHAPTISLDLHVTMCQSRSQI